VGSDTGRQARGDPAGARRKLGAGPERQVEMDLPPAARRQVSRRQRLQRRCGNLEPRPLFQAGLAASRSDRRCFCPRPRPVDRGLPQDRRRYGRDRLPAADQLFPGGARLSLLFEPGAIPEDRLVDRVRQGAVRHRSVQDYRIPAARQCHLELAVTLVTVLCVGVLRWPMVPVVLCLAPVSVGLALVQRPGHGRPR
jgi:hypothetical protein